MLKCLGGLILGILLALLATSAVSAADCEFRFGFKTLRDLIGHDIVGECGGNERYNAIGDSVQNTTGGLLVWRKSDNWTAFTDGHRTWINGPNGLVQRHINERFEWEFDYAPGGLAIINCRTDDVATFTQLPPRSSPRAESTVPLTSPSLIELARASGWYRDGLEYGSRSSEQRALRYLAKIDNSNSRMAGQMSGWGWLFDDNMAELEAHTLELFTRLDELLPNFVPYMLDLPWLHDGVDKVEYEAFRLLYREAICYDLEFAIEQATAPWVADGLSAAEQLVISILRGTYHGSQDLIPHLAQASWVQDGLTRDEEFAIWNLMGLSSRGRQDDAVVLDILSMPFLNGPIDALDVATLSGLNSLQHMPDRSYLHHFLSHPTLHGGVSDTHRIMLAGIGFFLFDAPNIKKAELLSALLDSPQEYVEKRVIWLPRAGPLTLGIVYTRPGTYDSMNILEHTVRAHENFMLEAYPSSFVHITFADFPGAAGLYWGGGRITLLPGSENNTHLTGHEVGHLYWGGRTAWSAEGGAEVLRAVAEGVPLDIENFELSSCQKAKNLAEIEKIEYEQSADHGYVSGDCPYVMGLGLYADLYSNLGDLSFRQGFRRMFLETRIGVRSENCEKSELGWCLLWKAFVADADTPEAAAIAEPIINRWYYGSPNDAQ